MLLQRVANGANAMSAYEALELATRGGADVLGRPECGRIMPGKRADLAIWDTHTASGSGSWDPAALVLAGAATVKHLFVEGRQIVEDGQLTTVDLPDLITRHSARAAELADTCG